MLAPMLSVRWALPALLLLTLRGCVAYEYEHEFWLDVDGSGTVYVTGRPSLWTARPSPYAVSELLRLLRSNSWKRKASRSRCWKY